MTPFWENILKWVGGAASAGTIIALVYKLLKIRITYDLREEFDKVLKKSKEDDKKLKDCADKEHKLLNERCNDLHQSIEDKVDMVVDLQLEFRELKGATEASLKAQNKAHELMNQRICIRDNNIGR